MNLCYHHSSMLMKNKLKFQLQCLIKIYKLAGNVEGHRDKA